MERSLLLQFNFSKVKRSPYPGGEVRTGDDAGQFEGAIVEPQGVYRLPDGQIVMSRECS